MNNKKIIYRNNIQKKHLDLTLSKRFNKRYPNVIKDIFSNLNTRKDTFHSLSENFIFPKSFCITKFRAGSGKSPDPGKIYKDDHRTIPRSDRVRFSERLGAMSYL